MKFLTRVRLATVRHIAEWLAIPVTVHEDALPEVMLECIDRYIEEAILLYVECWQREGEADRREEFTQWVTKLLVEHMHNPFNLHDHPLDMGMYFRGLTHADPESRIVDERFRVFAQTPAYAEKFRDGWRCSFGVENKDGS